MSTPITFKTKQELIEALEDQRGTAERLDAERKDKAEAEFSQNLDAYMVEVKKYAKMSKKALREEAIRRGDNLPLSVKAVFVPDAVLGNQWACSRSNVSRLERCIKAVSASSQERRTVSAGGVWWDIYEMLTLGEGC